MTAPRLQGLPPVLGGRTRLVVLGSFPGETSLREGRYYAHPRNQFWPLLSALWAVDLVAAPYERRLALLLEHGLGLWDVYASCRRQGSLDQAIEDARWNDFGLLKQLAPLARGIAHNGGESARASGPLRDAGFETVRLPSTSPANASWSFERKLSAWREVFVAYGLA